MKNIFLISEKSLNQIEKKDSFLKTEHIILFKETYKIKIINSIIKEVITSAQIAQDFLKTTNKKVSTNNLKKAKEITENFAKNFDIFLVYSNKILNEIDLENKIALIIEQNKQINNIDCSKIELIPPSPIIIEKILNKYPKSKIKTINKEDEKLFQLEYYYKNLI